MNPIIEISHLNKTFGTIHAVKDLSFQVRKGELFAFLGVNGAGKSTTISILCGSLPKDSGTVTINGMEWTGHRQALHAALGVVFQNSVLDAPLTVMQNLKSRAALYGLSGKEAKERILHLSALLHFQDILHRPVGKLSGGQRRRVDIARALLHQPEILILDEPTTGLDPQTRKLLWNIITRLREEWGLTVLLTTHYMEEAADADYIVIINQGETVAAGSPLALKNAYTGDFISLYGISRQQAEDLNLPLKEIPGGFRLQVQNTSQATALITQHPQLFCDYEITKGNMDDVFLAVTGLALTEGEEI